MTPVPVPHTEYIDNLWSSAREGLISWRDLNDLQATYLHTPRSVAADFLQREIRRAFAARHSEYPHIRKARRAGVRYLIRQERARRASETNCTFEGKSTI